MITPLQPLPTPPLSPQTNHLPQSQSQSQSQSKPEDSPLPSPSRQQQQQQQRIQKHKLYPYSLSSKSVTRALSPVKYLRDEIALKALADDPLFQGHDDDDDGGGGQVTTTFTYYKPKPVSQVQEVEEEVHNRDEVEVESDTLNESITSIHTLKSKSTKKKKPRKQHPQTQTPVYIESEKDNIIDCPNACGNMIRLLDLPSHIKSCSNRVITCPQPGCNDKILACDVRTHFDSTCIVGKRRRGLVRQKEEREKRIESEKVALAKVKFDAEEERRRKIRDDEDIDLNEGLSMKEIEDKNELTAMINRARELTLMNNEIKLMSSNDTRTLTLEYKKTLFNIHEIDPTINERAERARERHQYTTCPNCGFNVIKMNLMKHIAALCTNRKVPCKNWDAGCTHMVRLRDRANHEKVDHLTKPRSCLHFNGQAGYVDLTGTIDDVNGDGGESNVDVKPPWTAEYWVFRDGVKEVCINMTRKALKMKEEYDVIKSRLNIARMKMKEGEEKLAERAKASAMERGNRDAHGNIKVTKEDEEITANLIVYAEENEMCLREAAFARVEYYMLIKSAARLMEECESEGVGFDELVNDVGVKPDLFYQDIAIIDEEEDEELELEPSIEVGVDINANANANATVNQFPPPPDNDNSDPPLALDADNDAYGPRPDTTHPDQPRPPTTNLPKSAHPPIDWYGNGRSLAAYIIGLASKVTEKEGREREEEALTAKPGSEKRRSVVDSDHNGGNGGKKKHRNSSVKGGNGNGKGQGGKRKPSKVELKERRKTKRQGVHGVKLDDKIKLETIGQGGQDILSSSSNFKLSLCLGDAMTVGYSITGKGDYTFPGVVVPRGKWCHVAFVAYAPPKVRLAVYVDGKMRGYNDGVSVDLPMGRIGSERHCLQGKVQEVRYWAVARTKPELSKYASSLLPLSSPSQGLLGCWTFEEGHGPDLHDVTEQRYLSKIVGLGLGVGWTDEEEMGVVPPTMGWRERMACKVEVKRARLAVRGRMQFGMCVCSRVGCEVEVMRRDLRFHEKYFCEFSKVDGGDGPSWLGEEEKRKREELAIKGNDQISEVECPMGCEVMVRKKDTSGHLKNECSQRLVKCSNLGCTSQVPFSRIGAHEKYFCESTSFIEKNKMIERARKKAGYPMPWLMINKIAEEGGERSSRAEGADLEGLFGGKSSFSAVGVNGESLESGFETLQVGE